MAESPAPDDSRRPDLASVHSCIELIIALTAGSLERLAEEVGVSYSTLYGWASGRRSPTPENLLALAQVADRRADELRETAARLRELGMGEEGHPGPLGGEGPDADAC